MADDDDNSNNNRAEFRALMDLNLYLGIPRRSQSQSHDLGSDLALGLGSGSNHNHNPEPEPDSAMNLLGLSPIREHGDERERGREEPVVVFSPSPSVSSPPRPNLQLPLPLVEVLSEVDDDNVEDDVVEDSPFYYMATEPEVEVEGSGDASLGEFAVSYMRRNESGMENLPRMLEQVFDEEYVLVNRAGRRGMREGRLGENSVERLDGSVVADFLEQERLQERDLLEQGRQRAILRRHGYPQLNEYSRGLRGSNLRMINSASSAFTSYTELRRGSNEYEVSDRSRVQKSLVEEGVKVEKEEEEDRSGIAANFDCNVCLDVAKEPVVTSCGHLFCWPCLYQWLHLHSDHRECPVCKGEVTDANITPIYGRGSSETEDSEKKKSGGEGAVVSTLKIPPRPKGCRSESLRQRIHRPFLRRSGVGGLSSFIDYQEGLLEDEANIGDFIGRGNQTALTRYMTANQRALDEHIIAIPNSINLNESGSSSSAAEISNANSHSNSLMLAQQNAFLIRRALGNPSISNSSVFDRFATLAADLRRSNRIGNSGSNNSGSSASTSVNPQGNVEIIANADQASALRTIAVIQGEMRPLVDVSIVEPSSVASSQSYRRRRSSVAASSDVDGGGQRATKRRRLN